jgi:hypothetical protein
MENLPKPVITNENGKMQLKYAVGVDTDKDGQMAMSVNLVLELDQKEVAEEAVKKLLANANIPQWLKDLLGVK